MKKIQKNSLLLISFFTLALAFSAQADEKFYKNGKYITHTQDCQNFFNDTNMTGWSGVVSGTSSCGCKDGFKMNDTGNKCLAKNALASTPSAESNDLDISDSKLQGQRCSSNLIMSQNLRAPRPGQKYIRNGKYDWYTKRTVSEAHILQKHLNRLGFSAGKVDGIIGPNTRGAILRLQGYLGTKKDGYVGPKTRVLLNNSCKNSSNNEDKWVYNENKDEVYKKIYSPDKKIYLIQKNIENNTEPIAIYKDGKDVGEIKKDTKEWYVKFIDNDNFIIVYDKNGWKAAYYEIEKGIKWQVNIDGKYYVLKEIYINKIKNEIYIDDKFTLNLDNGEILKNKYEDNMVKCVEKNTSVEISNINHKFLAGAYRLEMDIKTNCKTDDISFNVFKNQSLIFNGWNSDYTGNLKNGKKHFIFESLRPIVKKGDKIGSAIYVFEGKRGVLKKVSEKKEFTGKEFVDAGGYNVQVDFMGEAQNVTENSARVEALSGINGARKKYFLYSEWKDFVRYDGRRVEGYGKTAFSATLRNLKENTKYYVVACIADTKGTDYCSKDISEFRTKNKQKEISNLELKRMEVVNAGNVSKDLIIKLEFEDKIDYEFGMKIKYSVIQNVAGVFEGIKDKYYVLSQKDDGKKEISIIADRENLYKGNNNYDITFIVNNNEVGNIQRVLNTQTKYDRWRYVEAWDIDGDGVLDPEVDGKIISRYLFDFSGWSLISGLDMNVKKATRKGPTEITNYLNSINFDVDKDEKQEALTDGIMIHRYMSNFDINNISSGATNTNKSSLDIYNFIASGGKNNLNYNGQSASIYNSNNNLLLDLWKSLEKTWR